MANLSEFANLIGKTIDSITDKPVAAEQALPTGSMQMVIQFTDMSFLTLTARAQDGFPARIVYNNDGVRDELINL